MFEEPSVQPEPLARWQGAISKLRELIDSSPYATAPFLDEAGTADRLKAIIFSGLTILFATRTPNDGKPIEVGGLNLAPAVALIVFFLIAVYFSISLLLRIQSSWQQWAIRRDLWNQEARMSLLPYTAENARSLQSYNQISAKGIEALSKSLMRHRQFKALKERLNDAFLEAVKKWKEEPRIPLEFPPLELPNGLRVPVQPSIFRAPDWYPYIWSHLDKVLHEEAVWLASDEKERLMLNVEKKLREVDERDDIRGEGLPQEVSQCIRDFEESQTPDLMKAAESLSAEIAATKTKSDPIGTFVDAVLKHSQLLVRRQTIGAVWDVGFPFCMLGAAIWSLWWPESVRSVFGFLAP